MSSILFALSIDRVELNDSQQGNHTNRTEHIIPLPVPVKSNKIKRKPLRQVISFDKNDSDVSVQDDKKHSNLNNYNDESTYYSAPTTCLNSPDPKTHHNLASSSEPTSSDVKTIRQFFPDSVRALDSPSQILSRLSECAKEIFSSTPSVDINTPRDDVSDLSVNNLKISESDSEEVAGSIDGSASCLELCFTEDETVPDDKSVQAILSKKDKEYVALQLKCSQIEMSSKEKINKLENVILDLSK